MADLTWWGKQSHVSKRAFQQQRDDVKWQIHVLAAQYTTVTNLVTIHYTVFEMAVRIARSNWEVRSFGNFIHSSPLAPTAERDSQQQRAVKEMWSDLASYSVCKDRKQVTGYDKNPG